MHEYLQLIGAAAFLSLLAWGAFGFFIAPYLMGQRTLRVSHRPESIAPRKPELTMAHNVAAAVVVFVTPTPMIIRSTAAPSVFQMPNAMTSSAIAARNYSIGG